MDDEVGGNDRRVVIIAGPNGAGKTTFAREFLPQEAALPLFVNADLIAAGLSPFDPAAAAIRAGRVMLAEIDRHAAAGRSFAWLWMDNSGDNPRLIGEGSNG